MRKIHITTLGCSKNTVDSEVLAGLLETCHFTLVEEAESADVIIINTCGFIEAAKTESIQAIFEALEWKKNDPHKKIFVAGCLTQRYKKEIKKEIPEVDALFGTEDFQAILQALGRKHAAMDNLHRLRKLSTPRHIAYLKIAEGCNHSCAFCAIPGIRGKYKSRSMESLLEESRLLVERGARELILISQDSSWYGIDLYGKQSITTLLRQLHAIEDLKWIRVLYWYPTNFPPDVLDLMRDSEKLLPYIDMPIQHISNRMLRLMRRGDSRQSIEKLYHLMRKKIPHIALRTTLILGHPGERDSDFRELHDFIREMEFDRLGTFTYSDEDHTPAFSLPDKVNPAIANERQEMIMQTQKGISLRKNKQLAGQRVEVIIDEVEQASNILIGRTYRDAPEIDNEVIINHAKNPGKTPIGSFASVQIDDYSEYELYGCLIV